MRRALIVLLMVLAGPAWAGLFSVSGSDDACAATKSRAFCLMSLVDLPDGPPDSTAERRFVARDAATRETIDSASRGIETVIGVTQIAGLSSIPGARGGGVLTLLGALGGESTLRMAPRFFVILPKSEIQADEEPAQAVERAMVSAMLEVFKEKGATTVVLETSEHKHLLGTDLRRNYRFSGGECDQKKCEFKAQFLAYNKARGGDQIAMPAWLNPGKEAAYVWSKHPRQVAPEIMLDGKRVALSFPMMVAISMRMPDWFYIYVSPTDANPMPFVMSKGKLSWFFAPGQEPANLPLEVNWAGPKPLAEKKEALAVGENRTEERPAEKTQ